MCGLALLHIRIHPTAGGVPRPYASVAGVWPRDLTSSAAIDPEAGLRGRYNMLHHSWRSVARPLIAARIVILLASALPAAACWRRTYVGPNGVSSDTDRSTSFGPRRVTGKEAPSTLLAGGGRCTVTAKRFDQVREGDVIWCAWRTGVR